MATNTLDGVCPTPLAPDTQNCTGYGIGCHGGECICQEGRTGRGDFVSGSPACHLDVIAVRVLWGLLIVAHALHLVYALHYLYTRPKRGKKWYRDFPFIAGVAAFISSLSFVPLGLIRVIDPGMTIGTSVAATILFMTASMGFWTVIHIITHIYTSLLTRSLRGRPEAERNRIAPLVSRFSRAIPIGWITSMLACLSVVFTLINPNDPWIMFGFAAGHFILAAVLMFLAMILFLFVVGPILDDLESVNRKTPDERLQRVAQKIDRLRKEIRNQAMIQILMSGIFGCWPYAQRFSSYELPIAWFGSSFVMAYSLHSISTEGKRKGTTEPDNITVSGTNKNGGTVSLNTAENDRTHILSVSPVTNAEN